MARLMLSLDGQILAEYNMNKERYTIGRLPDNDIRIDNPAVSGHHSLIINILNDSFLEDLNSTNGTYVNGKLIKKHAMQHGDVITVGHHQLRFVDSQDGDTEQDEFEKTMVITPSSQGEERIRRVGAAVAVLQRRLPRATEISFDSTTRTFKQESATSAELHGSLRARPQPGATPAVFSFDCELDPRDGRVLRVDVSG